MTSIINHIITIDDGKAIHQTIVETSGLIVEEMIQNRLNAGIYHQQLQNTQYKQSRISEYPPLQDLADALYWQSKGDNSKMEAYVAACEAVKEKYPKGV